MNVGDIMTSYVVSCSPEETLAETAQKMQSRDIGCCPVVEQDILVGVVTDRDIAVRSVAKGLDPNSQQVRDIMTLDPITADPSMSCEDACRLMSENQIRRLPVVENDRLVGIVALADLAIDLEEEEMVAETLEKISQPSR